MITEILPVCILKTILCVIYVIYKQIIINQITMYLITQITIIVYPYTSPTTTLIPNSRVSLTRAVPTMHYAAMPQQTRNILYKYHKFAAHQQEHPCQHHIIASSNIFFLTRRSLQSPHLPRSQLHVSLVCR